MTRRFQGGPQCGLHDAERCESLGNLYLYVYIYICIYINVYRCYFSVWVECPIKCIFLEKKETLEKCHISYDKILNGWELNDILQNIWIPAWKIPEWYWKNPLYLSGIYLYPDKYICLLYLCRINLYPDKHIYHYIYILINISVHYIYILIIIPY